MTKICSSCALEKPLESFARRKVSPDGLNGKCKECFNAYYKKYFSRSSDAKRKQIDRVNRTNTGKRLDARKLAFEYLLNHPCIDCGEKNPLVLEFDHKDPSDKSFAISQALSIKKYLNIEIFQQEMEKCDIRCCNCHKIKTANQFGNWKIKMIEERIHTQEVKGAVC